MAASVLDCNMRANVHACDCTRGTVGSDGQRKSLLLTYRDSNHSYTEEEKKKKGGGGGEEKREEKKKKRKKKRGENERRRRKN